MRIFILGVSLLVLTGCELLQSKRTDTSEAELSGAQTQPVYCLIEMPEDDFDHNCDLQFWLEFWLEVDDTPWAQRRASIEELSDSPFDSLKKVLLSQGRGTPYQNRLRAQNWLSQLEPNMSADMRQLMQILVYQPSQELLEFESALAILTRLNAEQSKALETQQQKLLEQQQQIEELLKIEASMMETREGINQ